MEGTWIWACSCNRGGAGVDGHGLTAEDDVENQVEQHLRASGPSCLAAIGRVTATAAIGAPPVNWSEQRPPRERRSPRQASGGTGSSSGGGGGAGGVNA